MNIEIDRTFLSMEFVFDPLFRQFMEFLISNILA